MTPNTPATIILAHDRTALHDNAYHVLFLDGRVDLIPAADLAKALATSNAARAQWLASTRP